MCGFSHFHQKPRQQAKETKYHTMATQMAMKSTLHRSKNCLHSVSSQLSDPLSSSESGLGLRPLKRSSSSLYLQGLLESESPSSSCSSFGAYRLPSLERQASSMSDSACSVDSSVNALSSSDPSNLIQWALILVLASQVPDLLKEIRFILDLHYHSFPVLVVLGSLPCFLKRPTTNKKGHAMLLTQDSNSNFSASTDSGSFRRNRSTSACFDLSFAVAAVEDEDIGGIASSEGDEWGHFAELDESTFLPQERNNIVKLAAPGRPRLLPAVPECEEEE